MHTWDEELIEQARRDFGFKYGRLLSREEAIRELNRYAQFIYEILCVSEGLTVDPYFSSNGVTGGINHESSRLRKS